MIRSKVLIRTKSSRIITSSQYWTSPVQKNGICNFFVAQRELERISTGHADIEWNKELSEPSPAVSIVHECEDNYAHHGTYRQSP